MKTKARLRNILKKRLVILDGATGTELQKRGMPSGVSPELWALENRDVMASIHRDYFRAGSDIIYACTFGANPIKLAEYGVQNAIKVNQKLAELARESSPKNGFVAGDIGSTGRFVKPFGKLEFEQAVKIFKEQIRGLMDGGVDLFVIETMMDIQEARAALIAVKELTDLFTIVTMTFEKSGRTLGGTDPASALITLQSLGADAVGCNCSTGPSGMMPFIMEMKPLATVPLVAKPNAGLPQMVNGKTVYSMSPKDFASYAKEFAANGVNFIGGCCGTTPAHIAQVKKAIRNKRPVYPVRKSLGALSSAQRAVVLDPKRPLAILGERINPTGKKILQEELRQGKTALIRELAREQEEKGATLLDVNVGAPNINEVKVLNDIVSFLSASTSLPLVLDSSNPDAIESALRVYPGRALINSLSGEKKKIEKLLPVAAKYGAMFILLPLSEKNIPEMAEKRIRLVQDIYNKSKKHGFTKDDFIVDGLVMAASSNPRSPIETLKVISWCTNEFGCRTVIGLSNVSFGLPQRKWINSSFLAQAMFCGLTMAIANPSSEELMNIKKAGDALLGKDIDAREYIRHFSQRSLSEHKNIPVSPSNPSMRVYRAIIEGNRENISDCISQALSSGIKPQNLVNDVMIPAITHVGDLYDRKEYFLPQLIAGAEAMKKGFQELEPLLKKGKSEKRKGKVILLATVKGDIHDIGKNIVALMLKNHGFSVIDLGKDISAKDIVKEIKRCRPSAVGLSALMTTTMVNIKDVIALARKEGLKCPFIIGGAVVTRSFAESVGASYAKDGVEAVRVAKKLKK
ncbi:MAG: homocysteine S-methyltransferase family protein [Candidatus Aureabacteria bacterium]|nr:homocysteine S-methyltransferase family protein [Candidatus Auribacterota bacterium]